MWSYKTQIIAKQQLGLSTEQLFILATLGIKIKVPRYQHYTTIYNKYRTEDNLANYKKQRNFCLNFLRKTKAEYSQKLNVKDLSDNRKFRKTIKPF